MTNDATSRIEHPLPSRGRRLLLWTAAVLLMGGAIVYQRRTGPTYPMRGEFEVGGQTYRYKLIRSEETIRDAEVAIPDPGEDVTARVMYKRFKTADDFKAVEMQRETVDENEQLVGRLPAQPAAGKLEYYVEIVSAGKTVRIPPAGSDNVVIRFKDPVPSYVLWPHVFMMFFSVLFGMRAGLSALFAPHGMRMWGWTALIGMTLGGMILGPIVQKYAFGEYWTGFPFGYDLTDNKMLIMWVAWLTACTAIGTAPKRNETTARIVVVVATVVMMAVYLIPHSMQGSELDYSKIDQGVDPKKAIGTGE